jgi:hypothetical protein
MKKIEINHYISGKRMTAIDPIGMELTAGNMF